MNRRTMLAAGTALVDAAGALGLMLDHAASCGSTGDLHREHLVFAERSGKERAAEALRARLAP